VESFCERGNEPSGSITFWELLGEYSTCGPSKVLNSTDLLSELDVNITYNSESNILGSFSLSQATARNPCNIFPSLPEGRLGEAWETATVFLCSNKASLAFLKNLYFHLISTILSASFSFLYLSLSHVWMDEQTSRK
jgi:hypothetical protein